MRNELWQWSLDYNRIGYDGHRSTMWTLPLSGEFDHEIYHDLRRITDTFDLKKMRSDARAFVDEQKAGPNPSRTDWNGIRLLHLLEPVVAITPE